MRLPSRVSRLEAPLPGGRLPRWTRVVAAEVAAEMGLDPEEVVREAESILVCAEAAGVLGSGEALATFVAAESGIASDVMLVEAQRILGRP
jgi:hypothetical protein